MVLNLRHLIRAGLRRRALALAIELALVIGGASLLFAVVAANGRPVVFADTNIYIWMGRLQLRPLQYAWGSISGGPAAAAQDPDAADEAPPEFGLRRTEMGARSPWFGLVLFVSSALGGLWTFAALQSLVSSYAIRVLWRAAGGGVFDYLGAMAVLAVGSTLPFFVGFAMPDLWAGVGFLALATLMFAPNGLSRFTLAALFLLAVAAMSFHHSNAPAAFLAASAAMLAARLIWRLPGRRLFIASAWLIAAVIAGLALEGGYALAVKAASGQALRSPPFLDARILADGPGRVYLRRSCAQGADWALCRFRHLPLDDSQDILWSGDPSKGVFGRANVDERIRIDREQIRFVWATVAFDPLGSLESALSNSWKTLINVNLEDPLRDPHYYLTDPDWKDTYVADLVHDMGPCGKNEDQCRSRFKPAPLALWHGSICLLALAWLAAAMVWKRPRAALADAKLGPIIAFLLLILVFNALVSGVLSGPFARYQARIMWLLPLAALLAATTAFKRRPTPV